MYKKYGVDVGQGVIAVVRPDQYIGSLADLVIGAQGTEEIEKYLRRALVPKPWLVEETRSPTDGGYRRM